jgi:hypothetical protein
MQTNYMPRKVHVSFVFVGAVSNYYDVETLDYGTLDSNRVQVQL